MHIKRFDKLGHQTLPVIGRNQRTKTYKQLPLDGPRDVLSARILKNVLTII